MRRRIKLGKRGFTLIEIVVVIIIIAILAAILVPALLNWIDSAKQKTVLSEADTLRKNVIAEMSELHKDRKEINGTQTNAVYDAAFWEKVSDKSGKTIQGSDSDEDNYLTFKVENKALTEMTYTTGGLTAVLKDGEWSVVGGE